MITKGYENYLETNNIYTHKDNLIRKFTACIDQPCVTGVKLIHVEVKISNKKFALLPKMFTLL